MSVKHKDIVPGQSYVGRGNDRTTRTVLLVGTADDCEVPPEHQRFLKLDQRFVKYSTADGTVSWDTLVSFAQWATSIDAGWPREEGDLFVSVVDAGIKVTVDAVLHPDKSEKLARWLRDAVRDKRHFDSERDEEDEVFR